MGPIFEAAGVETLGRVTRAVFVGTHKGAAESMYAENGREIRTLWGYLAWRLGGWKAVDTIADSEAAGTKPGSERLTPILRGAAPCLVLMDADFPAETREAACEEQMRRAYPLHPEVLRRFSGDWSVLDKFQRTRGVLKIMANAIYALWSGESAAPLITPALLPFRDNKVRTALLEPLDRAFGPILQSEVDGEQSLTARIEAQRPRLLRARAATLAARAVFFATAPHAGAARGAMAGTDLRLSCAQPGDQIAIFGEALQEIASRSAHLYRDGDRYWFSPQPTLNKLAADRARDVSDDDTDRRIIEVLREDAFGRFHIQSHVTGRACSGRTGAVCAIASGLFAAHNGCRFVSAMPSKNLRVALYKANFLHIQP